MKFNLIGTGNAAWHFATMLIAAGHHLGGAYSRREDDAKIFADYFSCNAFNSLHEAGEETDLLILAVSDDSIGNIAPQFPEALPIAHVSGTRPLSLLPQLNRAVIWPLQTLTSGHTISYQDMHLCIESDQIHFAAELRTWFAAVTPHVHLVDSRQRAALHLAAVWSCNFTNLLYRAADKLCHENGVNFQWLNPLVLETAMKIQTMTPFNAQTGPAHRGDMLTIRQQLEMLQHDPDLAGIYRTLTELIMNNKNGQQL